MAKLTGSPETGGRKRGTPNKTTALLKDAILQAAEGAGGKDGMIGYLRTQAVENPGPFMTLLGKVMPHQIAADEEGALVPTIIIRRFGCDDVDEKVYGRCG